MATLLLADDSLTTQKVVNLTFADEGIEVITADDGDTALQLFHERQPDVVLADVNMPGLNGYEVCEAIRKTNDSQKTPVVLLVGSFEPFDAHEAHRVGANDYLTKPFSSIRRLVATVLAFLDESPSAAESASPEDEIEEITVEPATPELEATASEVQESPAESEVGDPTPVEHGLPATEVPEPDMYSTNDIENLYTQSFAETVEMPHTVAERARFSDGSADDELIEATYTEPQAEESKPEEWQAAEPASQMTEQPEVSIDEPLATHDNGFQVSYDTPEEAEIKVEAQPEVVNIEPPPQEVSSAYEEPLEGSAYNAPEIAQEVRPQDAPTEEYNFEYRSEETYFEPAAEPVSETGEHIDTLPASEEQSHVSVPSDERTEHFAEPTVETPQPPIEDQPPGSTPWDSVAPVDREFRLDESNLLELPTDSSSFSANNLEREVAEPRPNETVSAETVERIARVVASQMSEQLIREIAERVVPMVVEETLARRAREEING